MIGKFGLGDDHQSAGRHVQPVNDERTGSLGIFPSHQRIDRWLGSVLSRYREQSCRFVDHGQLAVFVESNLGNVQLVGWMLVIGGVFMLFCDKIFNKGSEQTKLTYKRALTIGFIQCIAMIPGVSRSMSTIVGGMSQRLTRKAAAEFSFFLAVPTMFGATCLEVYKLISHGGGSLLTQGNNLVTLLLGSVVAFVVAILAIKFFINYVTKYGFAAFGWYRIVIGLIIIICGLCGVDMQMVD